MTGKARSGGSIAVVAQTGAGRAGPDAGAIPAPSKSNESASEVRPFDRTKRLSSTPSLFRRLRDPRSTVLMLLAAVLLIGGGRKLLRARNARKAVARLDDPGVPPEEIEAVAQYGRVGLFDLFRTFGSAQTPAQREAAGRAIARLWAGDQLVAEEEQAFTKRSYDVAWNARRRYPRGIRAEIPINVTYGIPFLTEGGDAISPDNLEWSHRIVGARRAALEAESEWKAGEGRAEFTIIPGDFESNGPHQLVLEAKVRTSGLTGPWQIELPKIPFRFEFDPILVVDSLLTLPDENRRDTIARKVRLESSPVSNGETAKLLPLHQELAIRNPPCIAVETPLPCDLAHSIEIEIEGVDGRFPAGRMLVSGQGIPNAQADSQPRSARRIVLGPIAGLSPELIGRPGVRRIRVMLKADPDLGWGDPEIRSIWPGAIETNWVEVEITRR